MGEVGKKRERVGGERERGREKRCVIYFQDRWRGGGGGGGGEGEETDRGEREGLR